MERERTPNQLLGRAIAWTMASLAIGVGSINYAHTPEPQPAEAISAADKQLSVPAVELIGGSFFGYSAIATARSIADYQANRKQRS